MEPDGNNDPLATPSKGKRPTSLRSRLSSLRSSIDESANSRGSSSISTDTPENWDRPHSISNTPARSVRFGSTASSVNGDTVYQEYGMGELSTVVELDTPREERGEPTWGLPAAITVSKFCHH